jgi:hypothetical protein
MSTRTPESSATAQRDELLNVSTRNTSVAVQFSVATVILLLPFVWTQLTGMTVELPAPPWMLIAAAAVCFGIFVIAVRPKTVVVTRDGLLYRERGTSRIDLRWQDVKEVANDVRTYKNRPTANIKVWTADGKTHELDSARINEKTMRSIFGTIAADVAATNTHIAVKDNAGWLN